MRAVDQWIAIEERLGDAWDAASLMFAAEDPASAADAAVVLAPLQPGRSGSELRLQVLRRGAGRDRLRNLLGRLDRKRIWGTLTLLSVHHEEGPEPVSTAPTLAESWDRELEKLPSGWRDLLCELELHSTDYLARAALQAAPLNPTRNRNAIALRFRVSRGGGGGYGAAPGMVRRCLERMDVEGITGRVAVLHGLSDTENVGTQGPVWRIAGRSV